MIVKFLHSNTKLIAGDLNRDKAFKPMHQSIMTKIKNVLVNSGLLLKQT